MKHRSSQSAPPPRQRDRIDVRGSFCPGPLMELIRGVLPPRPSLYYHMEKQPFNRAYWHNAPQGWV